MVQTFEVDIRQIEVSTITIPRILTSTIPRCRPYPHKTSRSSNRLANACPNSPTPSSLSSNRSSLQILSHHGKLTPPNPYPSLPNPHHHNPHSALTNHQPTQVLPPHRLPHNRPKPHNPHLLAKHPRPPPLLPNRLPPPHLPRPRTAIHPPRPAAQEIGAGG